MSPKNITIKLLGIFGVLCFMVVLRYPIYMNPDDAFTASRELL